MIVCQHCGTKNNDNFNCCYNCGTPLPKKASASVADEEKKPNIMPLSYSEYDETDDESITESSDEFTTEEQADNFNESDYSTNDYPEEKDNDESLETASYYSSAYSDNMGNTTVIKKPKPQQTKKKKNSRYEVNLSKLIPALIFALVALFVIFITITSFDRWFDSTPGSPTPTPSKSSSPLESDFNTSALVYSDLDSNGNKVFTLRIQTAGTSVSVLNNTYNVEDGYAVVDISELDIYKNYRPSNIQYGQKFDTKVPIIISKSGYADFRYEVEVQGVSTPSAPYELLSPRAEATDIYSTNTTVSFRTEKDSKIYINGTDYTEEYFDASTGIFSITLNTPLADEPYRYVIRIESTDYMTREINFELTRTQSWDPNAAPEVKVDKTVWETDDDAFVTITGTFMGNPDDLSFVETYSPTAVELVSLTMSNDGSGRFEAVVKVNKLGWSEVSVECKTNLDYSDSIYIKCLANSLGGFYGKYATSCKDVLKEYDKINSGSYKGDRFVTYGNNYAIIKSVEKTELGYAFYATLNNGTEDQLIYVETFEDAFTFEPGRKVQMFGNLYGDKDGTPRFLAVMITAK